mgnify:FL=1
MSYLITKVEFLPENIKIEADLHAAEEAYKLVLNEGISFRMAYQQIATKYSK